VRSGAAPGDGAARADSIARVAEAGSVPYIVRLGSPPRSPIAVTAARAVPDVRGLPVRRAVYALHRAGFRVKLGSGGASRTTPAGSGAADGAAGGTAPAAGARVAAGSTIHLAVHP